MKKAGILALFTAISMFCLTGQPLQSQGDRHIFYIHVDVSSHDQDVNTKNLVENYIKKELQKFKDVRIRNFDNSDLVSPAYLFSLVFLVDPTTGNIAIACGLNEVFDMSIIMPYIQTEKQLEKKLDVLLAISGLSYSHYMNVFTGNTNDLSGLCKVIIANVNTEVLKKQREMR